VEEAKAGPESTPSMKNVIFVPVMLAGIVVTKL
jgi:hypothetical protein